MSDILMTILPYAVCTALGACFGFFTAALLSAAKDRPSDNDKNK